MHPDHLIPRNAYLKTDIPIAGVAHQAGTCRFGTDPKSSVLDVNCKAHELDNLYVVDTSFFVSIGAVNPALTAMANAIRVGEHLQGKAEVNIAGIKIGKPHGSTCCCALGGEVADIYTAGMVQGLALVTFPAASTVLTSPQHYGLSSTEYATLFVPQAAMAVAASLLGARLIRHFGIKRIYLIGLTANLASMALLFLSQFAISNAPVAYGMLILATTSLGIGFGLTVPALNTFAAAFFPRKIDSAVLILNALLGLGTVWRQCLSRFLSG